MVIDKTKILVVDDEAEIVNILTHSLTFKGYDAKGAYNGQDALSILQKKSRSCFVRFEYAGFKRTRHGKNYKK